MAITQSWHKNLWDEYNQSLNDTLSETQHVIKGEMLNAKITLTEAQELTLNIANVEVGMKEHLANMIAEELLKSKYISFTKKRDIYGLHYFARAFVVPSDMVQLLRLVNK
jgi:predicted transcriptional regulator YdeE